MSILIYRDVKNMDIIFFLFIYFSNSNFGPKLDDNKRSRKIKDRRIFTRKSLIYYEFSLRPTFHVN